MALKLKVTDEILKAVANRNSMLSVTYGPDNIFIEYYNAGQKQEETVWRIHDMTSSEIEFELVRAIRKMVNSTK